MLVACVHSLYVVRSAAHPTHTKQHPYHNLPYQLTEFPAQPEKTNIIILEGGVVYRVSFLLTVRELLLYCCTPSDPAQKVHLIAPFLFFFYAPPCVLTDHRRPGEKQVARATSASSIEHDR